MRIDRARQDHPAGVNAKETAPQPSAQDTSDFHAAMQKQKKADAAAAGAAEGEAQHPGASDAAGAADAQSSAPEWTPPAHHTGSVGISSAGHVVGRRDFDGKAADVVVDVQGGGSVKVTSSGEVSYDPKSVNIPNDWQVASFTAHGALIQNKIGHIKAFQKPDGSGYQPVVVDAAGGATVKVGHDGSVSITAHNGDDGSEKTVAVDTDALKGGDPVRLVDGNGALIEDGDGKPDGGGDDGWGWREWGDVLSPGLAAYDWFTGQGLFKNDPSVKDIGASFLKEGEKLLHDTENGVFKVVHAAEDGAKSVIKLGEEAFHTAENAVQAFEDGAEKGIQEINKLVDEGGEMAKYVFKRIGDVSVKEAEDAWKGVEDLGKLGLEDVEFVGKEGWKFAKAAGKWTVDEIDDIASKATNFFGGVWDKVKQFTDGIEHKFTEGLQSALDKAVGSGLDQLGVGLSADEVKAITHPQYSPLDVSSLSLGGSKQGKNLQAVVADSAKWNSMVEDVFGRQVDPAASQRMRTRLKNSLDNNDWSWLDVNQFKDPMALSWTYTDAKGIKHVQNIARGATVWNAQGHPGPSIFLPGGASREDQVGGLFEELGHVIDYNLPGGFRTFSAPPAHSLLPSNPPDSRGDEGARFESYLSDPEGYDPAQAKADTSDEGRGAIWLDGQHKAVEFSSKDISKGFTNGQFNLWGGLQGGRQFSSKVSIPLGTLFGGIVYAEGEIRMTSSGIVKLGPSLATPKSVNGKFRFGDTGWPGQILGGSGSPFGAGVDEIGGSLQNGFGLQDHIGLAPMNADFRIGVTDKWTTKGVLSKVLPSVQARLWTGGNIELAALINGPGTGHAAPTYNSKPLAGGVDLTLRLAGVNSNPWLNRLWGGDEGDIAVGLDLRAEPTWLLAGRNEGASPDVFTANGTFWVTADKTFKPLSKKPATIPSGPGEIEMVPLPSQTAEPAAAGTSAQGASGSSTQPPPNFTVHDNPLFGDTPENIPIYNVRDNPTFEPSGEPELPTLIRDPRKGKAPLLPDPDQPRPSNLTTYSAGAGPARRTLLDTSPVLTDSGGTQRRKGDIIVQTESSSVWVPFKFGYTAALTDAGRDYLKNANLSPVVG